MRKLCSDILCAGSYATRRRGCGRCEWIGPCACSDASAFHIADPTADDLDIRYYLALIEMLTGELPFTGETQTDMLAYILARDPNWQALPVPQPPSASGSAVGS